MYVSFKQAFSNSQFDSLTVPDKTLHFSNDFQCKIPQKDAPKLKRNKVIKVNVFGRSRAWHKILQNEFYLVVTSLSADHFLVNFHASRILMC